MTTPSSTLFQGYVQKALSFLEAYSGDMPLHRYLKNAFRQHPQLGARDRRYITQLLYAYFRMGHTLRNASPLEKMLKGYFICEANPVPLIQQLRPEWLSAFSATSLPAPLERACSFLDFRFEELFPWGDHSSEGLDLRAFAQSFLLQPRVFLRIRPGHESVVQIRGNVGEKLSAHTWAFPASVDLSQQVSGVEGGDYVVQDYASQAVMRWLIDRFMKDPARRWHVWDCCAGSGGKSIYLFDTLPVERFMVTDIRPSILANLHKRFRLAGIRSYSSAAVDVGRERELRRVLGRQSFDLIIADVPCSGSGTWARTPEQLYFFHPNRLVDFQQQQRNIVWQAIPYLRPGAYFAYITCSVFREENEEVVAAIAQQGLRCIDRQLITSYDIGGDEMFIALFQAD